MSRMIETLHGGHRRHRPHLAARSRMARRQQLVGAAHSSASRFQADGFLSSLTAARPRRATQAAPAAARARFLNLDDHAVAAYERILQQLHRDLDLSEPRCVCLTSARSGEGKTTTSINLAFAASQQAQRRVIVVDANLAQPQVADRLGIQPKLGLSDLLVEGLFPSEAIVEVPLGGFDVLTCGQPHARAIDLLSSRRMDVLLWDLKQSYDLVIVDAPHVRDRSAANMFALSFDAVYFVVQMFRTRRDAVAESLGLLQSAGVTVRGCILTHEGPLSEDLCDATVTDADELPVPNRAEASSFSRTPPISDEPPPADRLDRSRAVPHASDREARVDMLTSSVRGPAASTAAKCQPQAARTNEALSSCSETITGWIQAAPTIHDSLNVPGSADDVFDISPSQENSQYPGDSPTCLADNPTLESALDTLQKLETIRPFDNLKPDAEDERVTPFRSETNEPDLVSALETSLDRPPDQPSVSSAIIGFSRRSFSDEIAQQPVRRRFRVHLPTLPSIESEEPDPNAVEPIGENPEITNETWAANVLAVCGGLLMLAGILFVAVDVVFWF